LPQLLSQSSSVRIRGSSLSSSSGSKENFLSLAPLFAPQQLDQIKSGPNVQQVPPEVIATTIAPPAIINDCISEEVKVKEIELNSLNEDIKSTLMILLNSDGVKNCRRYKLWVQTRLADAEKELSEFRWCRCKMGNATVAEAVF
jgi:hypothetical protein